MKSFVLLFFIFVSIVSCQNREEKMSKVGSDTTSYTTMHWIDSVKYIGLVSVGTKPEITFRFKNTGTQPLFIITARPGCGCTVADYPKEAISPNAEGVITASFDVSKGAHGDFRKNITVIANTKGSTNYNVFFYGKVKNTDNTVARQ